MKHTTGPRRGRPRGNGKRFSQGGGGKNQTFESTGPEVKIRGTAQQVYEKYLSLARDAVSAGDRIAAEGFFQFADHYYRLVNAANGNGQPRGDHNNRIPPPPESAAAFGDDGYGADASGEGDDEGDDDEAVNARDGEARPEPSRAQRPADEFRPMRPAEPTPRPAPAEPPAARPVSQAQELAEALARGDVEDLQPDGEPRDEEPAESGTGHRRGERTLGLGGRRSLGRRAQAAAEANGAAMPKDAEADATPDVPSSESREGGLFGPKPIRRRVRRVAPKKEEPAGAE